MRGAPLSPCAVHLGNERLLGASRDVEAGAQFQLTRNETAEPRAARAAGVREYVPAA
jgi:hypothetical protein